MEQVKKKIAEEATSGMILIDMNEGAVNDIEVGQKIKAYHSNKIYALALGMVEPLLIRHIEE
ncbi:MAG TPA: hypothetical protein VEY51_12530 [Chondromyces sp.]|nr:hypothetical protein [Chondromyces sp.]